MKKNKKILEVPMKTEYGRLGVYFGMQFGKPVKLPRLKKQMEIRNRQKTDKAITLSLQKQSVQHTRRQKDKLTHTSTNSFQPDNKGLIFLQKNNQEGKSCEKIERVRSERSVNPPCGMEMIGTYRLGGIIGKGSYSTVRIGKGWKKGSFAIKIYDHFNQYDSYRRKCIQNEISILQMMDHPLIVKYVDTITSLTSINIVTELINNVSLKQWLKLQSERKASQQDLRIIMKQILIVIEYLGQKNITHRDLKLQNILINRDLSIKVIDFGFSIKDDNIHYDFCGTPNYISPEIISKGGYIGYSADIWAAGIIFYKLASGQFPFKAVNDKALYRKICCGQYKSIENISKYLQDIINRMLAMDYSQRPKPSEILKSTWFIQ